MKNITNEEILILNQDCLQNTKIILHKNNIIFVIFVSITVFFAYCFNELK